MGYLISAYFDKESDHTLTRYICEIANTTGNDFMIKNNVAPHLTISFFEARSEENAKTIFRGIQEKLKAGEIMIPSIGTFFPKVLFAEAVLNSYLFELSNVVNEECICHDEVIIHHYYRPFSWIPHVTLAKSLDDEQMRTAFRYLQNHFNPITAKVVKFGLAKTNPHQEIMTW